MITLEKALQPLLPEIASRIHYEALFELMTIEPAIWVKLYHKLGEEIIELVSLSGSEIHKLFISKGIKTQQAQAIFIAHELKRHLRRIMQLSPYKHR